MSIIHFLISAVEILGMSLTTDVPTTFSDPISEYLHCHPVTTHTSTHDTPSHVITTLPLPLSTELIGYDMAKKAAEEAYSQAGEDSLYLCRIEPMVMP